MKQLIIQPIQNALFVAGLWRSIALYAGDAFVLYPPVHFLTPKLEVTKITVVLSSCALQRSGTTCIITGQK